jgi:hypothetical protein
MERKKSSDTKSYVQGNEHEMMIQNPKRDERKREKWRRKVLSHYYKSVFIFIPLHKNIILFNKRITRRMEIELGS